MYVLAYQPLGLEARELGRALDSPRLRLDDHGMDQSRRMFRG